MERFLARGVSERPCGVFLNPIRCVTLRRAPRDRPGLAGCLPRCVRADGRVDVRAKSVPTLVEPRTFVQWMLKEQHSHQTFGQWRRYINRMANPACHRPRSTIRVQRNDHPCHCRGRGCLLAPSTARIPPAGTLPPVLSNVRFANSLLGLLIESARVSPRGRRGMLSTTTENPEVGKAA